MKRLLIFLMAAVLIAFCAQAEQAVLTQYVTDDYAISYPDSWTRSSGDGEDLSVYMPDGMSNFNVGITRGMGGLSAEDLEDLFPMLLSQFQNQFDDVEQVDVPAIATYGVNTYACIAFSLTYYQGSYSIPLYMEQYYISNEDAIFVITATYAEQYSDYAYDMERVLASFVAGGDQAQTVSSSLGGLVTYYDDDKGYALDYPETWYPMDDDSINALASLMAKGQIEGVDMDTMRATLAQVKASDIFMLYAPDFASNLNVTTQPLGMSADAETLTAALFPTMRAQYESMFGDTLEDVTGNDSIMTYGDNEYAHLALTYTLMGKEMGLDQFFICPNETLYIITVTLPEGYDPSYIQDVEGILTSFTVTK